MTSKIIETIESERGKKEIPDFRVGDTVDVGVRIQEGDKERVQVFSGVVISRKGDGLREMFTVRRIVQGEGVERVFPLHSPNIVDIAVKGSGRVRRAKLYYLRDRTGKAARLKQRFTDRLAGAKGAETTADPPPEKREES